MIFIVSTLKCGLFFLIDCCYRRQTSEGVFPSFIMAQFGGQKNPPWATQFTATAVSQPGQATEHMDCKLGGWGRT